MKQNRTPLIFLFGISISFALLSFQSVNLFQPQLAIAESPQLVPPVNLGSFNEYQFQCILGVEEEKHKKECVQVETVDYNGITLKFNTVGIDNKFILRHHPDYPDSPYKSTITVTRINGDLLFSVFGDQVRYGTFTYQAGPYTRKSGKEYFTFSPPGDRSRYSLLLEYSPGTQVSKVIVLSDNELKDGHITALPVLPAVEIASSASGGGGSDQPGGSDQAGQAGGAKPLNISIKNPLHAGTIPDILNAVSGFLYALALAFVTVMVLLGGFQILTAAGRPAQIDKGKQTLLWAVIGTVVILIAGGIAGIIKDILGGPA